MKFLLLVYVDPTLVDALPAQEYDAEMRTCLDHADDLQREGRLIESQQLEMPSTAKSVRFRNGRQTVHDGPFAETKELLGGFNLIEAADIDEAVRMAATFPWTKVGCIEVRPVHDMDAERRRVGARMSA
jgi:hypothetical protein